MSISGIRDAFNNISLPHGVRCTNALLSYCDKDGKPDGQHNHQQLVFNCVNANDHTTKQYTSAPLPPGSDVILAAQAEARKAIGE